AVFCFTPITLPANLWWSAALNQLPQQIFMLLALLGHLRYLRTGAKRHAFLGPLALLLGLGFSEKTVLIVPVIGVLTWFYFSQGGMLSSLGLTLRRYAMTWVGYALVLVPFAIFYVTDVPRQTKSGQNLADGLSLAQTMATTVTVGLLGGPWRWRPIGSVDSAANPTGLAQSFALLLMLAVMAFAVVRSRRAWRAWSLAFSYFVVLTVLVATTRAKVVDPTAVGSEFRYVTDFAIVATLAIGLAFLPISLSTRYARDEDAFDDPEGLKPWFAEMHWPTVGVFVVVAMFVSSCVSTKSFSDRWSQNPARTFVTNARLDLPTLRAGDKIYDGVVPTAVIWNLLYPANLPTHLLGPIGLKATGLELGQSTTLLRQFGANGVVEDAHIDGLQPALEVGRMCIATATDTPVDVRLAGKAFSWKWVVQIDYAAESGGDLTVDTGTVSVTARVSAGSHRLFVAVESEVETVSLVAPDNSICISRLAVGLPQPSNW
ncbi:MAG: hypothetical protein ABIR57_14435, partial [Aeromicrobium sp.]